MRRTRIVGGSQLKEGHPTNLTLVVAFCGFELIDKIVDLVQFRLINIFNKEEKL